MKDSGVEWLGMVPEHWEVQALQAIARVKSIPDQTDRELLSVYLDLGVIRFSDIKEKRTNATSEDLSKYQAVDPGDFVLNNQQAWRGSVGVSKYRGVVSPAYLVLSLSSRLKSEFANLLFRDRAMVSQYVIASKGVGSIQRNLYWPYLKRARTLIPPLPEQVAIVRYLDYVDVRVRRLTEAKRKLIGLLTEYKQAIIHRAVTHGLDPNVPLKDSGIEWLGMVPQHWEVRRFKTEVANIIDQTDRRDEDDEYIALEHVESWTGKIYPAPPDILFDSQVKKFEPDDVLFGKLRPYLAKVARPKRKGVCVSEFFVFRPRNGTLSAGYLEQFLRSSSVIGVINSSTFGAKMPRTDWKYIGNLSQLIPPISEQVAIVEYLNRATAEINTAVARTERQIDLLNEYRTRLIADVVTGKLDVRDATLDPEERTS